MEKYKNIKQSLIIDIIFSILIIIVSFPVWLNFDLSVAKSTVELYENYDYIESEQLTNNSLIVYNNSNTEESYKLVLKTNNKFDLHNYYFYLNNKEYTFDGTHCYRDKNYNYYIIEESSLVAGQKEYDLKVFDSSSLSLASLDTNLYIES